MNIESNNDENLWKLIFTKFFIDRDAKKFHKQMIENDFKRKYLFLFVLFSLKNENVSSTFDFSSFVVTKNFSSFVVTKNSSLFVVAKTIKKLFSSISFLKKKKSKHWTKTTIDKINIQFEKFIRIRKSNSFRNFNHYIVLKNTFAKKMRSFYEIFMISFTKKKIVSWQFFRRITFLLSNK